MRIAIITSIGVLIVLFTLCSCSEDSSTEPDTTAPQVIITYPSDGASFSEGEEITITAEATDSRGMQKVEFLIDGEVEHTDSSSPYEYEWDTSDEAGSHTITAKAYDAAGNTALSDVVNVIIAEAGAPEAPYDPFPSDNAVDVSTSATLSWSCSDPDGDTLTYDVYLGTDSTLEDGELVSDNQSETTYSPGALNEETTYYWMIVASDGELEMEGDVWVFTTEDLYIPPPPVGFVACPADSFQMGDAHGVGESNELPVHTVNLNAFYIGMYEVTHQEVIYVFNWANQQGYVNCSSSTVTNATGDQQELLDLDDSYCAIDWDGSQLVFGGSSCVSEPQCPCTEITWYGSVAYCNYLSLQEGLTPCYDLVDWSCDWSANGYRLPTEAEWEYSARGATNTPDYLYAGSDTIDEVAWYSSNSNSQTHPVGQKQANGIGTYDQSGNVWEWCWDKFSRDYYSSSPTDNPAGPDIGSDRVARGGFWSCDANPCRVSFRGHTYPSDAGYYVGFRVCRNAD